MSGTDESRDFYVGIQIPHARLVPANERSSGSSYTPDGPRPGTPAPQSSSSSLVLEASGAQAAGDRLDTIVVRGGHPRIGGAQFAFRHDGSGDWYGWDPPITTSGHEFIERSASTTIGFQSPSAVTTENDWVVVAAHHFPSATRQDIEVHRRDPDTGLWSSIAGNPVYVASQNDTDRYPVLVMLPGNRIRLYHWVTDLNLDTAQIRCWESSDDGATWALVTAYCLPDALDVSGTPGAGTAGLATGRISVAHRGTDGQTLLLAQVTLHNTSLAVREQVYQWASDDDGSTFEEVLIGTGADLLRGYPSAVVSGGAFIVGHLNAEGPPEFIRLGSAFTPHSDVTVITVSTIFGSPKGWADLNGSPLTIDDGDLALVVADDGRLYAYGRSIRQAGAGSDQTGLVVHSDDYGRTWAYVKTDGLAGAFNVASWFPSPLSTFYPNNISATWQRGRCVMPVVWTVPTVAMDNSLSAIYVGGSTQVTLPAYGISHRVRDRITWSNAWTPLTIPSSSGWTGVGVGTETLVANTVQITTAAAAYHVAVNETTTVTRGYIVSAPLLRTAGVARIYIQIADGVNDQRIVVFKDGTGNISLRDDTAGGTIATSAAADATMHRVLVAVAGGKVSAWFREEDNDESREWTEIASNATVTDHAALASLFEVQIGSDGSASNHDISFGPVFISANQKTGTQLATGQTNPDDLFGRTLTAQPAHIDDGTQLAGVSGPATGQEQHHTDVRYDHPIEHLTGEDVASPSIRFQTPDTAAWTMAWDLGTTVADHRWPSETIGITYFGNLRTFDLEYLPTGGAWTKLGSTVDLTESVQYTRTGDTVVPRFAAGSSVAEFYVEENELVGGYFEDSAGNVSKILENTSGNWQSVGTQDRQVPVIRLESVAAGMSTAGTGSIWFPRAQVFFHLSSVRSFEALRISVPTLTAPTQPTELKYSAKLHIGPVYVFGTDPTRGWARIQDANTEIMEARDGKRKSRANGLPRRSRTLFWTDGIDQRSAQGEDQPNYVKVTTTSGSVPAAHRRDPAPKMSGLFEFLRGPHKLVTLAQYIPAGPPDTIVHKWQRMRGAIHGRIMGSFRINNVRGNPEQTEFIRVASITVEEEI